MPGIQQLFMATEAYIAHMQFLFPSSAGMAAATKLIVG
jgi:hypothetical protein